MENLNEQMPASNKVISLNTRYSNLGWELIMAIPDLLADKTQKGVTARVVWEQKGAIHSARPSNF